MLAQPAPPITSAPITWVAYSLGKAGKTSDWVKLTVKYDAPIYEKLMAAGVVRSWGIATPINHRPGFEWNLLTWVTVDNWAGVEKWAGASMQTMQARSHFDEVVRNAVLVPGKPGAKIGYFLVEHYLARPGQEAALVQLYKEVIVPVADKLVADGVVVGYGMHVQELHGQLQPGRKWTHRSWYAVSELGAIDRIESALVAAGLTPQQAARAAEVHDMSAHTDDVLMVLYQGAPPAAPAPAKK